MTATLHVRHTVEDFDNWKVGYDSHDSARRLHGASAARVLRDGNAVTILIDFPDETSLRAFADDPALREAMTKAGVIGAPEMTVLSPVEELRY